MRGLGKLVAVVISQAALLGLVVLSPPAAAAAGATAPVLMGSKYSDRAETPTSFSPDNYFGYRYVRGISWSSWGGAVANGTGEVSLVTKEESASPFPIDEPTSSVSVRFAGRRQCAGRLMYTTYSLALAPGAATPPEWASLNSGRFRCYLALPGGYHGERLGRHANCIQGLYEPIGDPRGHSLPVATWRPRPPGGSNWLLCRLHFSGWGGPRAIGGGVAGIAGHGVKGGDEWPIRIELGKPVWCPRASDGYGGAITYSLLKIRLVGSGLGAGVHREYEQRVGARGHRCELP